MTSAIGANPRYPLVSELRQLLLASFYARRLLNNNAWILVAGVIFPAAHRKRYLCAASQNCYTPPLHDIVLLSFQILSIFLKTTPATVGAVRKVVMSFDSLD